MPIGSVKKGIISISSYMITFFFVIRFSMIKKITLIIYNLIKTMILLNLHSKLSEPAN
jgi:hypothetical protein